MPGNARGNVVARRRRMSAAEVRSLMIDAGRQSVWNAGLTLDLNDSHFDDLIRNAAVPRSSVFRIWQTKADYLVDLFETLGGASGGAGGSLFPDQVVKTEVFAGADKLIEKFEGDANTSEGRRALLEEAVRTGVASYQAVIAAPSEWQTYAQMMISSPMLTDLPDGLRIADTHVQTERSTVIAQLAERYQAIFENAFGLKPRNPQVQYEHFVIAGASVVEGFAARLILAKAANQDADTATPTLENLAGQTVPFVGADGKERQWLPAAIAYLGVIDAYFEAK